jgi:hypothetical protein
VESERKRKGVSRGVWKLSVAPTTSVKGEYARPGHDLSEPDEPNQRMPWVCLYVLLFVYLWGLPHRGARFSSPDQSPYPN